MKILEVSDIYKNQSKHVLKANAISAMHSIVACDWSKYELYTYFKNTPLKGFADQASNMSEILVEDKMKELFEILKGYYHND